MSDATPPSYQPQAAQPLSPSDERLWATLAHVGGIITSWVAPLVIFLVFKDRGAFVRDNSRNALNFQITWALVQIANLIVGSVLTVVTGGLWGILQGLIALAAGVIVVVFGILAAVAANRGETYRYPLTIALVK